ncbi:MAG: hypothetical protein J1E63_10885 [Muribaculaceae bacterium]|nr:hypothetical protein [Muribaculaceae bacterium]
MKVTLERKDDPYPDPEERTPENFYLVRVADSPLYLAGNENYETAFKKSTDVQQFTFDKTTDDGDEYSLSNLLLNGYYRIANNSNLDEATINFGGTEVEDYKHPLLLVGKTYNLTLGSENNLSTHHDANNDKKADLNITGAKFVYRGEGATDAAAIADEVTPSTFTITEGKATGLENVVVEEAADAAEYYTIQGVKADATNLAPGLYIVRQGSKTSKVIIR